MKTSKIIFISFFGVVGLFLLSLLIQTDPENRGNKELREMKHEAIALPGFSHLVIKKGCNVQLIKGVTDSIKCGYHRDLQLVKPVYTIKGDTLILESYPKGKGFYTNVLCSQLKSVTIDHARLDIKQITFSDFQIKGIQSEISCYDGVSIQSMILDLKSDSRLWFNNSQLKSAQIWLEKSNAEIYIDQIDELKAELRDSSELTVQKVLHSDVKTDETSRYYSR